MKIALGELKGKLEILSNIYKPKTINGAYQFLRMEGSRLLLSNGDETVETTFKCDDEEIIKVLIPFIQFKAIVDKFESESIIDLTVKGDTVLITSGRSKYKLNSASFESYPEVKMEIENSKILEMDSSKFLGAIKHALVSLSFSKSRPILNCINFKQLDNEAIFTCTDGFRLSRSKFSNNNEDFEFNIIGENAKKIAKIIAGAETFEIEYNNKEILFRNGDYAYKSRTFEGSYPNVSKIISFDTTLSFKLNRKDLLAATERIEVIGKTNDQNIMFFKYNALEKNIELITKQKEIGEAKEYITEFEAFNNYKANFEVTFNINYLINALKSYTSDLVDIDFSTPERPFIIQESDKKAIVDRGTLHLILPVKIE